MVKEEITAINANKSCVPENIHPRLLKEIIDHISHPIALLFNGIRKKYLKNGNKQTFRLPSRKAKNTLKKTIDVTYQLNDNYLQTYGNEK